MYSMKLKNLLIGYYDFNLRAPFIPVSFDYFQKEVEKLSIEELTSNIEGLFSEEENHPRSYSNYLIEFNKRNFSSGDKTALYLTESLKKIKFLREKMSGSLPIGRFVFFCFREVANFKDEDFQEFVGTLSEDELEIIVDKQFNYGPQKLHITPLGFLAEELLKSVKFNLLRARITQSEKGKELIKTDSYKQFIFRGIKLKFSSSVSVEEFESLVSSLSDEELAVVVLNSSLDKELADRFKIEKHGYFGVPVDGTSDKSNLLKKKLEKSARREEFIKTETYKTLVLNCVLEAVKVKGEGFEKFIEALSEEELGIIVNNSMITETIFDNSEESIQELEVGIKFKILKEKLEKSEQFKESVEGEGYNKFFHPWLEEAVKFKIIDFENFTAALSNKELGLFVNKSLAGLLEGANYYRTKQEYLAKLEKLRERIIQNESYDRLIDNHKYEEYRLQQLVSFLFREKASEIQGFKDFVETLTEDELRIIIYKSISREEDITLLKSLICEKDKFDCVIEKIKASGKFEEFIQSSECSELVFCCDLINKVLESVLPEDTKYGQDLESEEKKYQELKAKKIQKFGEFVETFSENKLKIIVNVKVVKDSTLLEYLFSERKFEEVACIIEKVKEKAAGLFEEDNLKEFLFLVTKGKYCESKGAVANFIFKSMLELAKNCSVDFNTLHEGKSLLIAIIENDIFDVNEVGLVVDAGVSLNLKDEKGFTPLVAAAKRRDKEIFNLLVRKGANEEDLHRFEVDRDSEVGLALKKIHKTGYLQKYLSELYLQESIKDIISLSSSESYQYTAESFKIAKSSWLELIYVKENLKEFKPTDWTADDYVDEYGYTQFHHAVMKGELTEVKRLLSRCSAFLNVTTIAGALPLDFAWAEYKKPNTEEKEEEKETRFSILSLLVKMNLFSLADRDVQHGCFVEAFMLRDWKCMKLFADKIGYSSCALSRFKRSLENEFNNYWKPLLTASNEDPKELKMFYLAMEHIKELSYLFFNFAVESRDLRLLKKLEDYHWGSIDRGYRERVDRIAEIAKGITGWSVKIADSILNKLPQGSQLYQAIYRAIASKEEFREKQQLVLGQVFHKSILRGLPREEVLSNIISFLVPTELSEQTPVEQRVWAERLSEEEIVVIQQRVGAEEDEQKRNGLKQKSYMLEYMKKLHSILQRELPPPPFFFSEVIEKFML